MSHFLPHPRLALAAGASLALAAGAAFVVLSPPEPLPLLASVESVSTAADGAAADQSESSGTLAPPLAQTSATAADSVPTAVGGAVADGGSAPDAQGNLPVAAGGSGRGGRGAA